MSGHRRTASASGRRALDDEQRERAGQHRTAAVAGGYRSEFGISDEQPMISRIEPHIAGTLRRRHHLKEVNSDRGPSWWITVNMPPAFEAKASLARRIVSGTAFLWITTEYVRDTADEPIRNTRCAERRSSPFASKWPSSSGNGQAAVAPFRSAILDGLAGDVPVRPGAQSATNPPIVLGPVPLCGSVSDRFPGRAVELL
jgi:hypothetical protein